MAMPVTPVRAITNSLSSRSTPSVPSSSRTYDPLVKAVLRHRLVFRIFALSALFTWASVAVNNFWIQGGTRLGLVEWILNPIRPTNLLLVVGTWGLGVLPVLVLRKTYLTTTPTVASSPSQLLTASVGKTSTIHSLVSYTSTAIAFTIMHVLTSYIYESSAGADAGLTAFVKSKKHPYYLNGRTLYILLSQMSIASLYMSRNIMKDRLTVRWTASLLGLDVRNYHAWNFTQSAVTMILLTLISVSVHTTAFGLGRSLVLPVLYRLPLIPRLLRPFTAHFLRGPLSFMLLFRNWTLISRAYILGLLTILNWEFAETVFDFYVAEPLAVSQITSDPILTVTSGISSSPYIQHFAFSELRTLASDPSSAGAARRTALFADQKFNPTIWATLVRATLLVLGNDYQTFLRRGVPEQAAPAPPPATEKKDSGLKIPSTPLVKTNVLKSSTSGARQSPLRSALETLVAADGIHPAADDLSVSQIPELFRSVMSPSRASSGSKIPQDASKCSAPIVPAPSQWSVQACAEAEKLWAKWAPQLASEVRIQLHDWWTRERVSRTVEGSLPNRKMDVLAIETLCAFTCASLAEDRYGVVQRDIPRILEALVSFLVAIEAYQAELSKTKPATTTPEEMAQMSQQQLAEVVRGKEELTKADDVLNEVGTALKVGLVQIGQTFGHRLAAFKFPPRIASKLQGFVEYS